MYIYIYICVQIYTYISYTSVYNYTNEQSMYQYMTCLQHIQITSPSK